MQLQIAIAYGRRTYSPERLSSPSRPTDRRERFAVPTRPGPTVQRRRLGIELRRLREAAGKTIDEVAHVLECSDSKVSRIETGQVSVSPRDVRDMLEFYGVDDERRDELVEFARTARKKGWWEAYSDTQGAPLVGLEVSAHHILVYETTLVWGLLQTEDYARAVIRAVRPELTDDQVERWTRFRIVRQELLTQEDPPRVDVILEECVLRRPVGGRGVMRRQLQHLMEIATLPNLTLQVLPLSAGEHSAIGGAFHVYRFAEEADPDVVYLEQTMSDRYLERPDQVERHEAAFARLRVAALTPQRSASMLSMLVDGL
jgi:transcriptional regulator with XRE-family HTH domain